MRPWRSPRARAAALTWSCGPRAGFCTAPSAGSRVRLAGRRNREKREASGEQRGKKAPAPASPNAVQEEREEPLLFYAPPFPFFPLKRFGGRSARCAVPSWTTLVIGFFGAQSSGLAHAESRREVAGGGDGTGVRESSTRGRGAGRALQLDWVSVDFTLQRTRQPPLSSSRDYIPVKRFRKEGGLARNSPGL